MSTRVLIAYATRYGSTREVAEVVASALGDCGFQAELQSAREVRTLAGYNAIVLGAPLYMFRWHKDARQFLSRHRKTVTERPVAVFALGPVHAPHDESEWEDSRARLDKELAKFPWLVPAAIEIFGGKYDPENLRWPINLLAGNEPATDIRDWDAIRAWASDLAAKFESALPR